MTTVSEKDLTAYCDIHGNEIHIGTKVRSHDFAFGLKGTKDPLGMDTEGERASFVEGTVEAIGNETIEGCARYTIKPKIRCVRGEFERLPDSEGLIYPPLNGTRSMLGGVTCNVEVIPTIDEWNRIDTHWYANSPEEKLADFWESQTVTISLEGGKFWLGYGEGQGESDYETLDEAKEAAFWDFAYDVHTQKGKLLAESGLSSEWDIDLSDGIAFHAHWNDEEVSIVGCQMGPVPTWNIWTEAGQVPGSHPSPLDALTSLQHYWAARKAA